MRDALQWLRSLLFIIQMYIALPTMGLFYFPAALINRKYAFIFVKNYARYVRWSLAWMTGLKTETRGNVPTEECLIAAKHQSFLDVIIIISVSTNVRFILKRELHRLPIFRFFGDRLGNVPVVRGDRGKAIKKMMVDVASGKTEPGQLVIYPQGTRIAPGVGAPYKIGVGLLYEQTGQTCVPVATNVGVFWPKHGITRKPGLAVMEYLDPIKPGMARDAFMTQLEAGIETRSDALMAEAGFVKEITQETPDAVS